MKMLIVDGSNILMRCAFGGDLLPAQATPIAAGMIERSVRELGATHLVIALDSPGVPTWRKAEFPEYKAHRTRDTSAWIMAGVTAFAARKWRVEMHARFEADDIIAALTSRAAARVPVTILSNDSDLLALTAIEGVTVARPKAAGEPLELMTPVSVCEKYGIVYPDQIADFKALVGEKGDNVPGVPGIGATRAAYLLNRFRNIEEILAGGLSHDKHVQRVRDHADAVRLAKRLVTLRHDAPLSLLTPRDCAIARAA